MESQQCILTAKFCYFFAFTFYVGALWCPPMTWAFCGEHNLKDIKVKQLPGMQKVVFDQCRYGLVSLESKKLIKKPTVFATNCPAIIREFSGKRCTGDHDHCRLEGSEGGQRRTKAAQVYPEQLCMAVARCVLSQWQADNPIKK